MPTAHASRYLQQLCKHWAHNLTVTFDDPGAYARPWTVNVPLELFPDTELLEAADLLLSWESWERLRSQQGCSTARARRVVGDALIRLLEQPGE